MKSKAKNIEDKETKKQIEFVNVPVQVLREMKQKKHVLFDKVRFSPEWGNLFIHMDEKHTLLLKRGFLKKYVKVSLNLTSKVEESVHRTQNFGEKNPIESTARMKVLGKREGRIFVGPTGAVKYDPGYKGLQIHLDDKHVTIIDGRTLSRDVGLKIVPLSLDRRRDELTR